MWIFTTFGFYNFTQSFDDSSIIRVRTRSEADLDQLRELMPGIGPTHYTPERDYPFRAYFARSDFESGMAQLARQLDYTSFNKRVAHDQGAPRAAEYKQVWAVVKKMYERAKS